MANADKQWLDRMYNNRARVPEFARHLANWQRESALARAGLACLSDVPYGSGKGGGASERLDIFPAVDGPPVGDPPVGDAQPGGAPVLVFIHGGYWRSLDKSDHSFVATEFTLSGACVVVPNYALCPGQAGSPVTISDITLQMVSALAWVWRNIAKHGGDPARISVIGHSAGGHLAAMLMACDWKAAGADLPERLVKNAMSISGLFELESIRQTPFLQADLKLTSAQARQASPAWMPSPKLSGNRGTFYSVAGASESEEFLRHNRLIQKAWGKKTVPVCEALPGLNHFSILEALVRPGQRLNSLALDLLMK